MLLNKNIPVIGIVFLFVVSSVAPMVIGKTTEDNNTIYVDDDNTSGPWDGSQEHPFQYIQDGIDNAYEGYTVFVKNGLYHENIVINKSINLDGENKKDTIIDVSSIGHVIEISVPNEKYLDLQFKIVEINHLIQG